jgi:hypothetical protein
VNVTTQAMACLVFWWLPAEPSTVTEVPPSLRLEKLWQTGPYCGPNCLYLLMKALGVQVTHEQLIACFGRLDEKGTSLHDLSSAAQRHGLSVRVVKGTESSLRRLPLPFIAHLDMGPTGGHYVVVSSITRGEVTFVDGTQFKLHRVAAAGFVRAWTGYALVPARSLGAGRTMVLLPTSALCVLLLLAFRGARRRYTSH